MCFSQSIVLWQGRGGIQKIALFGKRPSPYYGNNSSNKQRETTVHHYFKTWRSVHPENVKNFESFFKCSRKNHQTLWWNCLSWGQGRKTQSYLYCRGYVHYSYQPQKLQPKWIFHRVQVTHLNINCSEETVWIRPSWSNCCRETTATGHQ